MPALNFTVFIDKIMSGEKCQTIRPMRKRPIKPGDKLYLYTGMRHKNCQKLGEAVCVTVSRFIFEYQGKDDYMYQASIICPGRLEYRLPYNAVASLVIDDGFDTMQNFFKFFIDNYKIPTGSKKEFDIIKWRGFQREI